MPEAGTLQTTLLQIAKALEPLQSAFEPDRAASTFAELGIVVDAGQVASLSTPIQALAASTAEMLQDATALAAAIEADDVPGIVSLSAELTGLLVTTIRRLDDLQAAVESLSGIPASVSSRFAERLFNFLLVR